jgi:hypothetical protein
MVKRGECLPGSSTEGGLVVDDVVVLYSVVGSLGVYQKEKGEETINIKQTNASQYMTWQYAMPGVI